MMDIKAIAATLVILTLTLLMGAVGARERTVSPDCSLLEPRPCKPLPILDEEDNISYEVYLESCPYHVCVAIGIIYPPASTSNASSKISMTNAFDNQRLSNEVSGGSSREQENLNEAAKSSVAFTSISEKVSSFDTSYDAFAPWFCSVAHINYTARVEASTGYPPGKKEDLYAQCMYQRLMDSQSLADCRHLRFTCSDCREYYRNWLCAMAFPRCYSDKTFIQYPAYNVSDPDSIGDNGLVPITVFSILKPCRGLCWGVVQRCQQYMNFNCPLTDTRDYEDYPNCNAMGFDAGDEGYATTIYW